LSRDGINTVGVCGSNPHAPTRLIGYFSIFVHPSSESSLMIDISDVKKGAATEFRPYK